MSLVQMQLAIEEHRANFEAAGVRGIDLDYLLDNRVDHKPCLAAFEAVVNKELARWVQVWSQCIPEQWAWFKAMEENGRPEMKALKLATRNVKDAFKSTVLPFFKEAEERWAEKHAIEVAARRKEKKLELDDLPSEGDQMRAEAIEQGPQDL